MMSFWVTIMFPLSCKLDWNVGQKKKHVCAKYVFATCSRQISDDKGLRESFVLLSAAKKKQEKKEKENELTYYFKIPCNSYDHRTSN